MQKNHKLEGFNTRLLIKTIGEEIKEVYTRDLRRYLLLRDQYPIIRKQSIESLLIEKEQIPIEVQLEFYDAACSVLNHSLFAQSFGKSKTISQNLEQAITDAFGSITLFERELYQAGMQLRSAGNVFLVLDEFRNCKVIHLKNNAHPLMQRLYPILCINCWDYCYKTKFQSKEAYLINMIEQIDYDALSKRWNEVPYELFTTRNISYAAALSGQSI